MNRHLHSASFIALLATSTLAQAWQIEASGSYTDFDGADDAQLGVLGSYHFKPVNDVDKARAESAFLARSSQLFAGYTTFDEADADGLGVGGELFFEDLYARGSLTQIDVGIDDGTAIDLRVGFLPRDGVLLSLGYNDIGLDIVDVSMLSLNAKWVQPLDQGMAYNAEASIAKVDGFGDPITYMLGGDLYLNQDLSVGLAYRDSDADNANEEWELRARLFVVPTLSLALAYAMQDGGSAMGAATGIGGAGDRITVSLAGRF
ncbi:MAG: putative porin [Oceanococcus sp.]|nr:MAG: putative porin [Oceanococcus sp.]